MIYYNPNILRIFVTQQIKRFSAQLNKPVQLDYLLHLPPDIQAEEKRPFILFLHGAGERGDDLDLVRLHGIPKVIDNDPNFPFIAVSPQCPALTTWSVLVDALKGLVDEIVANYPVDTDRIYLTGLSMGGYGSWNLAATFPDLFAAVAPVCGGGSWFFGFPDRVVALKETPIWAFHGAQDNVVPLSETSVLVDTLHQARGTAPIRFTIYPDLNHDSWTITYDNPELYSWFLKQKKQKSSADSK
ncbi:MAG: putative peptidase [Cellvibrionaceae bacterium]|jgi:predicted peptidase